ncbi:MAG: alpha/beta hydrolase [Eubacteriales bacterium]|nr:alpha/beta hydrolase [Eubacteriales bacterium]
MNRRRVRKCFKNNKNMGSYADICFEIIGDTDLGKESIRFDTKIHYLEKGKGEPLLLVHGIGQSLFTWRNNIDFFAGNGYRVLAIDLAGCGYSGCPNIYFTVEEYALIIKAFLDTMGIKKAHIAAFSTGCLSAICFAASHPGRAGKLILVSPGGPNENYPFQLKFLSTWLGHKLFMLYFKDTGMHNILCKLYFDATLVTDNVVEGYYRPYENKDVRDSLAICITHFDDTYARSLLKSITQDTFVFSGSEDKIHPEDMIRSYTVTIPKARHHRLRNCAHFVHEEKPSKFNSESLAFLKKSDDDTINEEKQMAVD